MCGICGLIDRRQQLEELESAALEMAKTLTHRGPDSQGVWSEKPGIAIAHRRLSILDLSAAGHQPMLSHDERWALTYNGEIYNFQDTRMELEKLGYKFRGHSDTEILVNAISQFGFVPSLQKSAGMFALAAWDRKEKRLYLGRDRFGQKPLFYGLFGETFLFGSELRAAKAIVKSPELDLDSIGLMLRYKTVPAPKTLYKGLQKLPPGCWTSFSVSDWVQEPVRRYWKAGESTLSEPANAEDEVKKLFEQAVRQRMISDVPLGAFLSGGIDSTLVVAEMQRHSSGPVKTFTIGFEDQAFDEATQASLVAKHLGTEHTELRLSPQHMLEVVPELARIYDEPFGDSSQVPTYLVSKLARQHVTVALSGDGGDELFGGYNRHVWLPRISAFLAGCPRPIVGLLRKAFSSQQFRVFLGSLSRRGILPVRQVEDKLDKLQLLLEGGSVEALYRSVISDWKEVEKLTNGLTSGCIDEFLGIDETLSRFQRLCLADIGLYLPDDILTKVDRASMAVSLEARSPFLDHRLAEQALMLGKHEKVRWGKGKVILRTLLAEKVPANLFERPKMGFAVPIASWLRKELREWAEDLLTSDRIGPDGLLSKKLIKTTWSEHVSGQRNHHDKLWNILMLLAWLREND